MIFKFLGFLITGHVMFLDISIDYDGTIIKDGYFPNPGPFRLGARPVINWLKYRGHTLILNTCRCNNYRNSDFNLALAKACDHLHENEIPIFRVNDNKPRSVYFYGVNSRKLSVDLDIDDRSLIPWAWWMVPFFVLLAEYKKFKEVNQCGSLL